MKIAIQGEKGAFSHEAVLAMVPGAADIQSCALSAEVFERVADGRAEAAVVPIENSLAGSVLEHYDLLLGYRLRIDAEYLLRIRHCLITAPGVELDQVREAYSHPVALAQCRRFFSTHPSLRPMPFYDTAGSVVHAVQTGAPTAGIASEQAAREHGGAVLLAGIEDNAANYTRFFLLRAPDAPVPAGIEPVNKVSLAFAVPNEPGSLVGVLKVFASYGLNLSRLESRPVPGSPWEYVFYADYQLSRIESADRALAELTRQCRMVRELGRYPSAAPLPLA